MTETEKRWTPAMDALQSDADKLGQLEYWAGYHDKKGALNSLMSYGCPVCNGDCASANPPVVSCPMKEANAAISRPEEAIRDAALTDAVKIVRKYLGAGACADAMVSDIEALKSAHSPAPTRVDEAAMREMFTKELRKRGAAGEAYLDAFQRGEAKGDACMQAALAALKPYLGGWRTMESAPKDVEILAFFDCRDHQDDGIVDIVYWDDKVGPDKIGGWHLGCESDCSRAPGYYTHWMPLPASPDKGGE